MLFWLARGQQPDEFRRGFGDGQVGVRRQLIHRGLEMAQVRRRPLLLVLRDRELRAQDRRPGGECVADLGAVRQFRPEVAGLLRLVEHLG